MKKKKQPLIILGFLAILTLGIGGYRVAVNRRTYVAPELVEFIVRPGDGALEIARRLREANLIRSPILFTVYTKLSRTAATLQAGRYYIGRDQNIREIAELLQHGAFDIRLTIPEGWRREEIASLVESSEFSSTNLGGDTPQSYGEDFLRESVGLEGYLFPDTYLVGEEITAVELVAMMRGNFDNKVDEDLRAKFERQGLNLHQAITLASIVEREVLFEEDRAKVAGILLKRLENGWPLEADATVQYAVASVNCQLLDCEWWPKELTQVDLDTDSSYNTRLYPGLPPAPIGNPGLAALGAVGEPEESPFWFYISDETGKMYYAATLEEHNQNVSEYLQYD